MRVYVIKSMKLRAGFLGLVLLGLFLGGSFAQNCYQCLSMESDVLDLPTAIPGAQTCDGEGYGEVIDCSDSGGCQEADLSFIYNVPDVGEVDIEMDMRDCGDRENKCLDEEEVQELLDQAKDQINEYLETIAPGLTFLRGSGTACVCDSELCNSAAGLGANYASLFLSLFLFFLLRLN